MYTVCHLVQHVSDAWLCHHSGRHVPLAGTTVILFQDQMTMGEYDWPTRTCFALQGWMWQGGWLVWGMEGNRHAMF